MALATLFLLNHELDRRQTRESIELVFHARCLEVIEEIGAGGKCIEAIGLGGATHDCDGNSAKCVRRVD